MQDHPLAHVDNFARWALESGLGIRRMHATKIWLTEPGSGWFWYFVVGKQLVIPRLALRLFLIRSWWPYIMATPKLSIIDPIIGRCYFCRKKHASPKLDRKHQELYMQCTSQRHELMLIYQTVPYTSRIFPDSDINYCVRLMFVRLVGSIYDQLPGLHALT